MGKATSSWLGSSEDRYHTREDRIIRQGYVHKAWGDGLTTTTTKVKGRNWQCGDHHGVTVVTYFDSFVTTRVKARFSSRSFWLSARSLGSCWKETTQWRQQQQRRAKASSHTALNSYLPHIHFLLLFIKHPTSVSAMNTGIFASDRPMGIV